MESLTTGPELENSQGHYQKRAETGFVADNIARAAEYTNVQ